MSYGAIYKITNKETGKMYIGKSINPKQRWKQHINVKKFNKEEYTFEIIAEYNSKEDLTNAEEYWIFRYNAIIKGYNKSKGREDYLKGRIKMEERIAFATDEVFKKALEQYCKDRNISMSSFIKGLIGSKLIEENYLEKGGDVKHD